MNATVNPVKMGASVKTRWATIPANVPRAMVVSDATKYDSLFAKSSLIVFVENFIFRMADGINIKS